MSRDQPEPGSSPQPSVGRRPWLARLVYDKKQYKWFPIEINDIICQIYYIQTLSSCIRNVQTLGEVSDERDV